MQPGKRRLRLRESTLLAGWLFADLLLGLAIIFLAAGTVFKPPPVPTPIPTPTPTPVPLPRLELGYLEVQLHIDAQGLLNNDPAAIAAVKAQVRAQRALQGRTAGLVIIYDGAPDDGAIQQALEVDRKIEAALKSLGDEHFVFYCTSYYADKNPLYILGGDPNTAVLHIYLYTERLASCPPGSL
jgi:hypothetical protein